MDRPRGAERRRARRRQVSKRLALVVNSSRDKISSGAFAVDLSDLGVRIRAKIHLEPGQLITVIPSEGPSQGIPSQVVWVNQAGDAQEAGIAFLEPLGAGSQAKEAAAS